MNRAFYAVVAIVVGATLSLAGLAHAQTDEPSPDSAPPSDSPPAAEVAPVPDPPERIEARQRYQQGVVFFRAERFHEAIAEFEAAYTAWDNPLILYSLGQSHEHLLEVPQAIDAYTRYLAAVSDDDPRRAEVSAKIDTLRLLLASVRVECNVPATLWVNGQEAGVAPGELQLAVGRWEIEVRADGYETHREVVQLAARASETLDVTLAPAVTTRVVEHGSEVPVAVFASFTAAALAATGVAIGLGVHTLDLGAAYRADPLRTPAAQAEGRSWSTATDIVGIGAGALAITAFVLAFLTDWNDGAEETASPPLTAAMIVTPNGAMLSLGAVF